jgi:hypothetical protein
MFIKKDTYDRLKNALLDKESKIASLTKQIDSLKNEIKNMIETRESSVVDCGFEIDFFALKAFSIERLLKDKKETTNIGYFKGENIQEWTFYCSKEIHERLVEDFKKYIANKR